MYQRDRKYGDPYMPSNGTEGMWFTDKFCDQCIHQHPNPDKSPRCDDILIESLVGNQPKEWIYDSNGDPYCTKFQKWDWGFGDDDDWNEPGPPEPEDPDQLCFPWDIIEILGTDYDLVSTKQAVIERELIA